VPDNGRDIDGSNRTDEADVTTTTASICSRLDLQLAAAAPAR